MQLDSIFLVARLHEVIQSRGVRGKSFGFFGELGFGEVGGHGISNLDLASLLNNFESGLQTRGLGRELLLCLPVFGFGA